MRKLISIGKYILPLYCQDLFPGMPSLRKFIYRHILPEIYIALRIGTETHSYKYLQRHSLCYGWVIARQANHTRQQQW